VPLGVQRILLVGLLLVADVQVMCLTNTLKALRVLVPQVKLMLPTNS
jgi:hypothetical protein